MRWLLPLALVLLIAPLPAQAQSPTVTFLRQFCDDGGSTDTSDTRRFVCEIYITGVVDFHNLAYLGKNEPLFCVPEHTVGPELRIAITKWLDRNTEPKDAPALMAVSLALRDQWPCPGQ